MKMLSILKSFTMRGVHSVLTSGALIAGALMLRWFFPLPLVSEWLMSAAALIAGLPILLTAYRSLTQRHVSIELLVSLAAIGALIIGEFWEAAAVTFLFALGGYLEARTMARTRNVIGELLELAPAKAIVMREGLQMEVAAMDVIPGEHVIVKPGSKIPVDGVIIEGTSSIDESAITGESWPRKKGAGDTVFAATFNQSGFLTVEATAVGEDTTLSRIIQRVEEAQEAKAPTQRFMERFSRWYTPFIILLSAVVFFITGSIEFALTILVIGCPGALVISTPVSIVAGIGGAAKEGILMKGGAHLEQSGRITAVAMDKTGTLTEGSPTLTRILPAMEIPSDASGSQNPEQEILYWAAVAESGSEHPIAGAILKAAQQQFTVPNPESAASVPGRGIDAYSRGNRIRVGSARFMEEAGFDPAAFPGTDGSGATVLVALNEHLLGGLSISDPIRESATNVAGALKKTGVRRIVMLTGDNHASAEGVAEKAGITEVYADLLPEDKLNRIEALRKEGYVVAMVGDGINDAPAMAAADIGIAMGASGTDLAIETADIALMRNDLDLLARAIRRAHLTLRNIRQNVFIAVTTVSLLLAGVLLGEVQMAGGMLVHEASVMIVILNGMRLLRLK